MTVLTRKSKAAPKPKAKSKAPAAPRTATTASFTKIPPSLRGIDLTTLRGPEKIPSNRQYTGFVPISGSPVITGIIGHGPLETSPTGPYGSYINAGERASTSTPLTATGERWSTASPQWVKTETGGHINASPALAGIQGEGTAPQSPVAVEAMRGAMQTSSSGQYGGQDMREYINGVLEQAQKTGQGATVLRQASTMARQLGVQDYQPPSMVENQFARPSPFANVDPVDFGSYLSYARARRRGLA